MCNSKYGAKSRSLIKPIIMVYMVELIQKKNFFLEDCCFVGKVKAIMLNLHPAVNSIFILICEYTFFMSPTPLSIFH